MQTNTLSVSSQQPAGTASLHIAFFLSGAAGLVFELIWFRLAALGIGSTLWAATLVLAAFMLGLAIGNGLAAVFARRFASPIRVYIWLEILVAASGLCLCFLLPVIGGWMSSWFRPGPGAWYSIDFIAMFLLMLIPTSAMGATLPLLVRAVESTGNRLGSLYGLNTLGAVSGILLLEVLLLEFAGVMGAAMTATLLCLAAAGTARLASIQQSDGAAESFKTSLPVKAMLAAAFSGLTLLGLEVVWFRLLVFELRSTETIFSWLLAVILLAMALGSLLSHVAIRRRRPPSSGALALAAALTVPISYLALLLPAPSLLKAAFLIVPVALISGAFLPVLANETARGKDELFRITGWLWLANTAGAALGAALAGLYMIPVLGMEATLLCLSGMYFMIGLGLLGWRPLIWPVTSVMLMTLVFAAQGSIQHLMDRATESYRQMDGSQTIARRQGIHETVQLLERHRFGLPYSHRLVTDGYSMSGTERDSLRYMKLFAWLPQSLHPDPDTALLISYGVGSTARALLDDERLQQLTIVDISQDVLSMSAYIHGDDDPLRDGRSKAVIEDGRHFLQGTDEQFDLITAEPPPPRMKGIVNLYSREYFTLLHKRLSPGGMATYWLPVDQLTENSSKAIVTAFCSAFADCSLWAGSNYNWILLGSRNAVPQPNKVLWNMPSQVQALHETGLEQPAALWSTFLADADQLRNWVGGTSPLSDYWPRRLALEPATNTDLKAYAEYSDNLATRDRYSTARNWVTALDPELRAQAYDLYDLQPILNNELAPDSVRHIPLVHRLLTETSFMAPALWLLGSDYREQALVDAALESGYRQDLAYPLGVRALVMQDFRTAASLLQEALSAGQQDAIGPAVYSLCRQGLIEEARRLAGKHPLTLTFRCWP